MDAGWNSELAVRNIDRIVTKLNLDLITHVVDWEDMKELQLAFMRSNLANQDIPQDHAFFAALYGYALKANIRYVINGTNMATESILPKEWGYDAMDAKHLKAVHRRFGTKSLKTFPIISFFQYYFYFPRVRGRRVIAPLDYIPYNKDQAISFLEKTSVGAIMVESITSRAGRDIIRPITCRRSSVTTSARRTCPALLLRDR